MNAYSGDFDEDVEAGDSAIVNIYGGAFGTGFENGGQITAEVDSIINIFGSTSRDVSRESSGMQSFQVTHLFSERIRYEARQATGELYDAFIIEKDATGKSTLTEQIPKTPEVRR